MARSASGDLLAGLDSCAREPVHIIGHIQSHGLLFALSEPDLVVRQLSANVLDELGQSPDAVLGETFAQVLGAEHFETFRSHIFTDDLRTPKPLRMLVGDRRLAVNCVAHRQDGVLIAELEILEGAHSLEPIDVAAHVRVPFSQLEQASDVVELSRVAASEVRRLSGFDRVLVYQFDEDWNGEVIAEAAAASPVSYLGLCFPASDIPAQARQLFLKNPLRAIADVSSAPVPIVPELEPLTGKALDLTRSFLRSASPIHIQYLQNMGVGASMTVSIIVQDRLWGMIACHHQVPRTVDCSTRSVCELIGKFLASQLAFRIDNAALKLRLTSRTALENYMAGVEASVALFGARPLQSARLLELFAADGLISRVDNVVSALGVTVAESELIDAVGKLRTFASRGIASSGMLATLDHRAESFADKASGALYVGLTDDTGDYLLLLRREHVKTVSWAGNPDKAVNADANGALRPRTSFAVWQQTLLGRSRPWTEVEIESARFLREQLLRIPQTQRMQKLEEQVRYLQGHDELTGLLNRSSLHVKLDQCRQDAAADRSSFAVFFIDLDRFDEYNDRLGHAAADRILQTVAARLQQQIRGEDVVGRLGGDEFIVIMPRLLESDAVTAVERIVRAIAEPVAIAGQLPVCPTATIGISWYHNDGTSSEALIAQSQTAMARAKNAGAAPFEPAAPAG